MSTSLYSKTPTVTVLDNRGLTVRDIAYHRHPGSPDVTSERITRHQYDARGFLTQSADPRLSEAGLANFSYQTDLTGTVLRTVSADAGTVVSLNDAAGRPFMAVNAAGSLCRFQYEDASLPGRPLSVTEQVTGEDARITERFVYAGNSDAEKALNLAGACISHYDTAGLTQTDSVALTGAPLAVTRRLLKDADNPDAVAGWQGDDASAWNDLLDGEAYATLTTADATGAVLTTTDAKGNQQRVAYDVAGRLSGSWLMLKGGKEQAIIASLTYSAAGQKLREEHGNGVVTTYEYEPETQRLTGIKTERPAGHASGAKVLQDLRYTYDPVGNVLKISSDAEETRFWRNQKVVPENTYVYDSLYQLVSATGREMANAGQQGSRLPPAAIPLPTDSSAYTNYTRTYSYDNAGNLTQVRHSPASGSGYTTNITVSNRSNRGVLSTLTENAAEVDALFTAGGQQKQLQPGQSLVWTPRNELLKVTPVVRDGDADDSENYRYDTGSQRVLKVSVQKTGNSAQTQRALYLPGLELRTTKSGDTETENLQVITVGEAGRAQVRVLHWESGKPAEITGDQVRYSYDNLTGSSWLELDGDGNVINQEEYYPYGGTSVWTARSQVEADYKTLRYSGKERDATGLYYYGYRYYQPWAGRWLSADPAGTVDGLNLFRMIRNNPVTLFDPDGHMPKYAPIAKEDPAFSKFEDGVYEDDINVINRYANSLDAIKSVVDTIHDAVDNTFNAARGLRTVIRNGTNITVSYTATSLSGLAGASAGALIGTAIAPGVGTAIGTSIGSMAGGLVGKKLTGTIMDNAGLKKKERLQTSKLTKKIDRANAWLLSGVMLDLSDAYISKDAPKTFALMGSKKAIKNAAGISLPVEALAELSLQVKELGAGTIGINKRTKIESIFRAIEPMISDDIHNEIQGRFESLQKEKTKRKGIINSVLFKKISSEDIYKNVIHIEKRISDTRRMLHN